jgi:hypothetical protein
MEDPNLSAEIVNDYGTQFQIRRTTSLKLPAITLRISTNNGPFDFHDYLTPAEAAELGYALVNASKEATS